MRYFNGLPFLVVDLSTSRDTAGGRLFRVECICRSDAAGIAAAETGSSGT
jgi:hypothetical protein